ncbi:MAG: hypothetical protein IJL39_04300 [Clostridia bacterium]|jgi:hypothetical protein|nr:hypothetical protein [Clostridia bacterium]
MAIKRRVTVHGFFCIDVILMLLGFGACLADTTPDLFFLLNVGTSLS